MMNDSCGHSPGRIPRDNMSMSYGVFALPCTHACCACAVGSGTVCLDMGRGHLRVLWEARGRRCEVRTRVMRASRGGSIWRVVLEEVEHAVVGGGMVASGGI